MSIPSSDFTGSLLSGWRVQLAVKEKEGPGLDRVGVKMHRGKNLRELTLKKLVGCCWSGLACGDVDLEDVPEESARERGL